MNVAQRFWYGSMEVMERFQKAKTDLNKESIDQLKVLGAGRDYFKQKAQNL